MTRKEDALNIDILKELPLGTKLHWVIGAGNNAVRHPAKVVEHSRNQIHILVYFIGKPRAKIRWSLTTNQPVGQSKGYVGDVTLELPE